MGSIGGGLSRLRAQDKRKCCRYNGASADMAELALLRPLLMTASALVSFVFVIVALVIGFVPTGQLSETNQSLILFAIFAAMVFAASVERPRFSVYWIILAICYAAVIEMFQPLTGRDPSWLDILLLSEAGLFGGLLGGLFGVLCFHRPWVAALLRHLPVITPFILFAALDGVHNPQRYAADNQAEASITEQTDRQIEAEALDLTRVQRPQRKLDEVCGLLRADLDRGLGPFVRRYPIAEKKARSCLLLMNIDWANYTEFGSANLPIGSVFFQLTEDETKCLCSFRLKVRFLDPSRTDLMFDALIEALKALETAAEFQLPADLERWRANQRIPSFKSANVELRYWPERTARNSFNLYITF